MTARPEQWNCLAFTWALWYSCNYRCSYCWWEQDDLWEEMGKRNLLLPPAEWIAAWDRVYDRHGTARINMVGGEPTLYPGFDELVAGITRRHFVMATTNLSLSVERLKRLAGAVGPDRFLVEASFHPEFSSFDDFLERLEVLRAAGHEPWATLVAWPPELPRIGGWLSELKARLPNVTLQVFTGRHEGRRYPDAYGPEERALIKPWLPAFGEDWGLEARSPLGRRCGAGHVYASVQGRGEVQRCGTVGEPSLGNILDPEFRLQAEPKPCPAAVCKCNEYQWLWDHYAPRHDYESVPRRAPDPARA